MPELPEVVTVQRTLEKMILGKKILNVDVYYAGIIRESSVEDFKKALIGQTYRKIKTYGKYLIFILDNCSIISHLRMEGKYFIKSKNEPINTHEHVVFTLDDVSFRYHDTRKFGEMILCFETSMDKIMEHPKLKKLAKEAHDVSFSKEELYSSLSKKNTYLKTALLDQEVICGLGNIYVDEVCFETKLSPMTLTKNLDLNDSENILKASRVILNNAISCGGTTIRSYTSSLGVTGRFQINLKVHSRENSCDICHTQILKTVVGGRGTYYCPCCQRIKGKTIIGLTGSISAGKSIISSYLRDKGYLVIDADEIVFEEKEIGKSIYNEIVKKFKKSFLNEDKTINNQLLTKFIFENDSNRIYMNNLIHPIVFNKMMDKINNSKSKIIFVSVPLLYEASFDVVCDKTICVYVNDEVLIQRLMDRNNLSYQDARTRIDTQMPQDEKCRKSNFIIDNSFDLCYTYKQLDEILRKVE